MKYYNSNKYVGVYPDIKAKEHEVNQFEYHPTRFYNNLYNQEDYNLGDSLSFVVVDWMLSSNGINAHQYVTKKTFLNTIGSNLFSSYQNATIWGSGAGAINELSNKSCRLLQHHFFRSLDVRAVRGPLTRDLLLQYGHKCPQIYGDPAILMPLIYPKSDALYDNDLTNRGGGNADKRDFLVIPQFLSENEIRDGYPDLPMVSMNTIDYRNVIGEIVKSKRVITSSLHGIILAEAYGVPAVFFKTLKRDFKFKDYYASTGRDDVFFAESLEEAMAVEPPKLPDLSGLQQGLIDSFPYDLWE